MTYRTILWNAPMSDKYLSMSPYNFCANYPIIPVDPDGRVNMFFGLNGNRIKFTPGLEYKGKDDAHNHQVNKLTGNYNEEKMGFVKYWFKRCSNANSDGICINYPIRRDKQKQSLLKDFYPLSPWQR